MRIKAMHGIDAAAHSDVVGLMPLTFIGPFFSPISRDFIWTHTYGILSGRLPLLDLNALNALTRKGVDS